MVIIMDKNFTNALNADLGITNISGVKNESLSVLPEKPKAPEGHAAGDLNLGDNSITENASAHCEGDGRTNPSLSERTTGAEVERSLSSGDPKGVSPERLPTDSEKEDAEFLALIKGRYKEAYKRRTESIIRRRLGSGRGKRISEKPGFDGNKSGGKGSDAGKGDLLEEGAAGAGKGDLFEESAAGVGKGDLLEECAAGVGKGNLLEEGTVSNKKGTLIEKESIPGGEKEQRISEAIVSENGLPKAMCTADGKSCEENHPETQKSRDRQRSINKIRPRENGVGGSIGIFTGINVSALKGSDILEILRRAEGGERIKFR